MNNASPMPGPSRFAHLVPAVLVLCLASVVAWLSFTQEPAGAFLFPRLISAVMFVLALWNFLRAASGVSKVGVGIPSTVWTKILPGLLIMSLYVFYGAKTFGFYVASTAAFFLIFSAYDPAPHRAVSSWLKRAVITLFFMGIVYALFSQLLKVQTPRGMFF